MTVVPVGKSPGSEAHWNFRVHNPEVLHDAGIRLIIACLVCRIEHYTHIVWWLASNGMVEDSRSCI
jgi:hypothetical protein